MSRSVIVERDVAHPPEKVWRALTQNALLEDWLMPNDFAPEVGKTFAFRTEPSPHWNGVVDCEVLTVEPLQKLGYSWVSGGIETVVTWTLQPTDRGTRLRMEQSGFGPGDERNFQGAQYGWQRYLTGLERVLEGM